MKRILSFLVVLSVCLGAFSQVSTEPAIITKGYTGPVKIIFNPAEGNGGMVGATQCFAHTGLITSKSTSDSNWKYTICSWRDNSEKSKMQKEGDNWVLDIPNINTFYGCPESEEIIKIAFVFNDGKINGTNGEKEGKTSAGTDIFVELADPSVLVVRFQTPASNRFIDQNSTMTIKGVCTKQANLTILLNNEEIASNNGTEISTDITFSQVQDYNFTLRATTDNESEETSVKVIVMKTSESVVRPEGIEQGIYYDETDDTHVTLCTYAASKTDAAKAVFVVGDFNDWQISSEYQCNRDGNYFWIDIKNLIPQKEYAFQYVVIRADGAEKRISDLFSEKLLHPDDKYEPKRVDPKLMSYPSGADGGYVTVIQTGKPEFEWSEATLSFKRPNKNNLIIYEVWVYDYTEQRGIAGLMERLDYIENLGVNAIELMPVSEFDGNYNWGYSPNHYFALDKAYATPEQFKTFVDECHKRGIAVIIDMVFNHATGLNPMNKLYPYGTDLKNNPWFCTEVPHDDNVYEKWNHDFEPAKAMFTRALKYWLEEYRIDGYRMDLSHGLCGCGTKSTYDYNKLMNNISHYYFNGVLPAGESSVHGEPYFILEHWGPNMDSQRPTLVNQGMLCWQNTNNAYSQTAMGYFTNASFDAANRDGYVSYCESHDEERNFYKAKTWGVGKIKTDSTIRLSRIALNMAFNVLLNGPHMIWQYNEIGYDFSINSTQGSTKIDESNRTSKKARPEKLGYFYSPLRMGQYKKIAQAIQLRTRIIPQVFEGNPNSAVISSSMKVRTISWGSGENAVFVMGNFAAEDVLTAKLPSGNWYSYLDNSTSAIAGDKEISLQPGELRIFTAKHYELPDFSTDYNITEVPEIKTQSAKVYPTITDGKVFIDGDVLSAQLFDLNGHLINTYGSVRNIELGNVQSGLYILQIQTSNKETTRVKILKK